MTHKAARSTDLSAYHSPLDSGFAGWSYDPGCCSSSTAPSSGAILYVRVKAVESRVVTNLWVHVGTAGATLTTGQCLLGLYDSTGAQIGLSADQSTAWTSTGSKSGALAAGAPVLAGQLYYIGILAVGTTPPAFARTFSGSTTNQPGNAGIASAPYRFNSGATAQTALPSTVTLTSLGVQSIAHWAAMS